jgi:hypothetical protein
MQVDQSSMQMAPLGLPTGLHGIACALQWPGGCVLGETVHQLMPTQDGAAAAAAVAEGLVGGCRLRTCLPRCGPCCSPVYLSVLGTCALSLPPVLASHLC